MNGIYLHIPFCETKCIYCDFYSIPNAKAYLRNNQFIDALCREIRCRALDMKSKNFDTIFFGGGTPSLLSIDDFSRIFDALYRDYNIAGETEITIEANPGTLDKNKLRRLKRLPVNRLSFGVQSFNEKELKFLTRIHSSRQAINCVKAAQDAGFENLSIDLIFALPHQSLDNWVFNLKKAVSLRIQHLSAYSLIFEEDTHLKNMLDSNRINRVAEELEGEMYELTINYLTSHGFSQYEVSNFAKEGFECRHNLKYWNHDEYMGFGPSAASFVNSYRCVNIRDINKYMENVKKDGKAFNYVERIDKKTSMDEFIFLGLRSKGVDIQKFQETYNLNFLNIYRNSIRTLIKERLAFMNDDLLRLTPRGYALCDEIAASYF